CLLVGKNITQETRLTWQLDQLQPLSSSYQKTVDSDAVLSELAYLAKLPNSVGSDSLKGWLSLLLSVLDDIALVESDVDLMPLGTVFCQESERVMLAMGVEANRAKIDCSGGDWRKSGCGGRAFSWIDSCVTDDGDVERHGGASFECPLQ
ncbi:hypothetical protein N5P32_11935, partial [Marinomonas pontica]|nr:hypothetical protein [Marinomonas pontica]